MGRTVKSSNELTATRWGEFLVISPIRSLLAALDPPAGAFGPREPVRLLPSPRLISAW